MIKKEDNFKERVCEVVSQIPEGKVMTYGQIAAFCGSPRAARIVGGIAHCGDPDLPWRRVVKKDGSMAEGYPGGTSNHRSELESEGIKLVDNKVIMSAYQWSPKK